MISVASFLTRCYMIRMRGATPRLTTRPKDAHACMAVSDSGALSALEIRYSRKDQGQRESHRFVGLWIVI